VSRLVHTVSCCLRLSSAFRELRELRAARDALRSADDAETTIMRDDHQSMRRVVDWTRTRTRDEEHRGFPNNNSNNNYNNSSSNNGDGYDDDDDDDDGAW
jgi:hypothetical protein